MPFDTSRIPELLRPIIPFAERYGVGDSAVRSEVLGHSTLQELRDFVAGVAPYVESIRQWAGGDAPYSEERYAFLCLAEACEEAATDIVIHPVLRAKIEGATMKLSGQEPQLRQQAIADVDEALKRLEDSEEETF